MGPYQTPFYHVEGAGNSSWPVCERYLLLGIIGIDSSVILQANWWRRTQALSAFLGDRGRELPSISKLLTGIAMSGILQKSTVGMTS